MSGLTINTFPSTFEEQRSPDKGTAFKTRANSAPFSYCSKISSVRTAKGARRARSLAEIQSEATIGRQEDQYAAGAH
jgi:hypothetical protein